MAAENTTTSEGDTRVQPSAELYRNFSGMEPPTDRTCSDYLPFTALTRFRFVFLSAVLARDRGVALRSLLPTRPYHRAARAQPTPWRLPLYWAFTTLIFGLGVIGQRFKGGLPLSTPSLKMRGIHLEGH